MIHRDGGLKAAGGRRPPEPRQQGSLTPIPLSRCSPSSERGDFELEPPDSTNENQSAGGFGSISDLNTAYKIDQAWCQEPSAGVGFSRSLDDAALVRHDRSVRLEVHFHGRSDEQRQIRRHQANRHDVTETSIHSPPALQTVFTHLFSVCGGVIEAVGEQQ